MDREETLKLAQKVLSAWNEQEVEAVVACYTLDCVYLDPNTGGPLVGREALRGYLARLFEQWTMHWSLREFFGFEKGGGGAFLWTAKLTAVSAEEGVEIEGMDLVLLDGDKLSRNEVYFDRMRLAS